MARKRCIFGPVQSRRLGLSLGVDLLPFKTCSMDCVYCECGATTDLTMRRTEFIPTKEVLAEIDQALASGVKPDFITFSGAGEPTLHSGIGMIIEHIKTKHPSCKVSLLTNSTTLPDPQVARELAQVDLIVPSLDGSTQEEFERMNRPAPGLRLEEIAKGIADFRKISNAAMWLEIFIAPGINDSLESAERFKRLVAQIKPDKVQLNTLDRPGTEGWVGVPSKETLDAIAKIIGEEAPVESVGRRVGAVNTLKVSASELNAAILDMALRRPCTAEDVAAMLNIALETAKNHLERMEREALLSGENGTRGRFYRPTKR